MPRTNRVSCAGLVWHITHRCHQRSFLLKFSVDRRRWRHWVFEATRRYGLTVLNYVATSNHVHLLVADQGNSEISASMQLVAGRTAQEYNQRKDRKGAFWEDRYHPTAVQTDRHLSRCLTYIDLNMVRAGAVWHPREWDVSGYHEIQHPRRRQPIINQSVLCDFLGISNTEQLRRIHRKWVADELDNSTRSPAWTEGVGVGDTKYLSDLKLLLGVTAYSKNTEKDGDVTYLREKRIPYMPPF